MAFSFPALALLLAPSSYPDNEAALKLYESRRLTIETVYFIDQYGGREVIPQNFQARTGGGLVLSGPQFYTYVDRADLASEHRNRLRRKKVLTGFGFGMLLSGAALTLGSVASTDERTYSALVGSGAALMIGSVVPIAFAIKLPSHPVTTTRAAELVEAKNKALRAEFGITGRF